MTGRTTVRAAVFDLLRARAMTTIFGNPGSTELPMFRDFPDDFRYILGLQESVVIGMADGYAQATRTAAFVNLHSAAGTGHALGNLFTAYRNRTPLVVTAGQQARAILPLEPFLYAEDAAQFPRPYVKWSIEPARAEDVPAAIARAWHIAMQPPRGPTFVSVPADDWDRACDPVAPRTMSSSVRGDRAMMAEAAAALAAARNPVFVVGAGVALDDAWDAVIALAERHQALVWTSPQCGRNGFPEDHRLFAGFLAARRADIVRRLAGHDLVLVLGAPAFTYHVEEEGPLLPDGADLIQLIDDPSAASCAPRGRSIVTGLRAGIEDLLAGPRPDRPAPPPPRRADPVPGTPFTDAYLFQRIAALRPAGSVIVEEAPGSRIALHAHLPITDRDGFYTTASGGLGHGLPASVGIALGRPGDKIICILGDGSSMYAIQGLWNAARWRLAISFVIVNNRGYRALDRFGRHFGLDRLVGTALPGIDYCGLAAAQGVRAERVDNADALDAALRRSFAAPGPMLVEVVVG